MAIDNLLFLAADPDKIPIYMNRFSEGTGSAAQLLGSLLPLLQKQPLALDKIYIHSADSVPANARRAAHDLAARGLQALCALVSARPLSIHWRE